MRNKNLSTPLPPVPPTVQQNNAIVSLGHPRRNASYAILALLTSAELLFLILFRKVNLDEGWYLWASKLVLEGKLIYRDFVYTQTPLLPYVYGTSQKLLGEGLYQGRIVTSLFTGLTILLCTVIVYRRAVQIASAAAPADAETIHGRKQGHLAAFAFLLLFGTSYYALAYLTYTATYALATLLLISALAVVVHFLQDGQSETVRNVLATILMIAAIATRLSILAAGPPLFLFLIFSSQRRWRAFIWIAISGALVTCLLLGSFWVLSDGMMIYDIFGFHTDRILSVERQIKKMLRVLGESGVIYLVPILLSLGAAAVLLFRARWRATRRGILQPYLFEWMLVAISALLLVMHLIPRTTASYYNTLQAPLLCMLGALALVFLVGSIGVRWPRWMRRALAIGLVAIHATINGAALLYFDLLNVPLVDQIAVVEDAAAFLRRIELPNDELLTLNTHLALESGLRVPVGYEMSIFSYRPDWTTERAQQFKAVNNELLIADLSAGVGIEAGSTPMAVAMTAWDHERFFGDRQMILDALGRYRLVKTVPNFDPFYNDLYIYLPPGIEALEPVNSLPINLEGQIQFLGYDVDQQVVGAGEKLHIGLYWQAPQNVVPLSYTGFAQLINAEGQSVTGFDNPPCHRTCPTESWLPGEVLRDEYILTLPEDLDPGVYTIQVGMYSSDNGVPLPVITRTEDVIDNRIVTAHIEVE